MSNKYRLQQKADAKNILIDTGPLSLLLIGSYKADKLKRFRIGSKKFVVSIPAKFESFYNPPHIG